MSTVPSIRQQVEMAMAAIRTEIGSERAARVAAFRARQWQGHADRADEATFVAESGARAAWWARMAGEISTGDGSETVTGTGTDGGDRYRCPLPKGELVRPRRLVGVADEDPTAGRRHAWRARETRHAGGGPEPRGGAE